MLLEIRIGPGPFYLGQPLLQFDCKTSNPINCPWFMNPDLRSNLLIELVQENPKKTMLWPVAHPRHAFCPLLAVLGDCACLLDIAEIFVWI